MNNQQIQIEIHELGILYPGRVRAVRNVSLDIRVGEVLGIVGESGCGKSTLAAAIMGDIPGAEAVDGELVLHGSEPGQPDIDLMRAPAGELHSLWGRRLAMVYQDPARSLNPTMTIGRQMDEAVSRRPELVSTTPRECVLDLLDQVHLPDPAHMARRYAHQLSGGQQQRVVIAMALAANPDVLVLDEPTTGLDVTTEARILDLVRELRATVRASIIYITHNLAVVARVADRVAVMYSGEICELGPVEDIFADPVAPYTKGLFACLPTMGAENDGRRSLQSIPGMVPSPADELPGCRFAPRCPFARPACDTTPPTLEPANAAGHLARCLRMREIGRSPWLDMEAHPEREPRAIAASVEPLIRARGLSKTYGRNGRRFIVAGPVAHRSVAALHDVTFDLYPGETLGVVGESGCGKTTLLAALTGLVAPSEGSILIEDHPLAPRLRQRDRADLRALQIVFQNPERSLNPHHAAGGILRRAVHTLLPGLTPAEELARVVMLLESVGLSREYLTRFPAQLSGGEKQRVALARALAGDARLILADEVTSALDVSVRASILNLMAAIQRERGLAYIFVSHDMSAVHHIADRVMVLYLGMVMELGRVQDVFRPPYHPYAEALLSAIPIPDPKKRSSAIVLEGTIPSATQRPAGCPFHTRCPRIKGPECATVLPPIHVGPNGHQIRCHWQRDELAAMQERVA